MGSVGGVRASAKPIGEEKASSHRLLQAIDVHPTIEEVGAMLGPAIDGVMDSWPFFAASCRERCWTNSKQGSACVKGAMAALAERKGAWWGENQAG